MLNHHNPARLGCILNAHRHEEQHADAEVTQSQPTKVFRTQPASQATMKEQLPDLVSEVCDLGADMPCSTPALTDAAQHLLHVTLEVNGSICIRIATGMSGVWCRGYPMAWLT